MVFICKLNTTTPKNLFCLLLLSCKQIMMNCNLASKTLIRPQQHKYVDKDLSSSTNTYDLLSLLRLLIQ